MCVVGVCLVLRALDLAAWAQTGGAAPDGKAPSQAPPTPKQQQAAQERIAQWIRELDDDRYVVREAATVALTGARREAISLLAKAAIGGSAEVSARSIAILGRLALDDDAALADAAREALEGLTAAEQSAISQRAAGALSRVYAKHAERAKKKLYELGVIHGSGENFIRKEVQRDDQLMLTKKRWKGKSDDLRLLAYAQDITYLSIHGVRLDADALPHLARLKQLRSLELYGTGLDAKSVAKLREALPGLTRLDVRSGGVLGVSRFGFERCELREIMPDTPAAKAGLRPMDIVTHIDGKPLETYRALISYLATRAGGDKVKLLVERGGEKVEIEVILASWGDE
jgi:hypothetical protein